MSNATPEYWDINTGEELTDLELHDRYDEMLDEVCDVIRIGNLTYCPSHVLKEVDPTAYRCGFNDWLDSELKNGTITDEESADEDEDDDEDEDED